VKACLPRLLILLGCGLTGPLGVGQGIELGIGRGEEVFPAGVWSCLVIAPRGVTEESWLLRFSSDEPVAVATNLGGEEPLWRNLSYPRTDGYRVFFQDSGASRSFEGRFDGGSITGSWRTTQSVGEWWCAPVDAPALRGARPDKRDAVRFPLPRSIVLSTPRYPRDAIRNALEGRVVTCFKVDATGRIFDPVVLEQTDIIFREPTLIALGRSNFAPWPDGAEEPPRPACRTYTFRLEPEY
jgi:hypothetical protein